MRVLSPPMPMDVSRHAPSPEPGRESASDGRATQGAVAARSRRDAVSGAGAADGPKPSSHSLPHKPAPMSPPAATPHGLGGGLVVGLMAVVSAVSFAALVFAGPLASQIGTGLGLALLATAINLLVVAGLASLPGTVGGSQSLPVAIVAACTGGIAHDMARAGATQGAIVASVVLAMVASGVITGAVLLLLGHWRASRLVRLLPYPVIGGVVAGTGLLLGQGALNMAIGSAPAWHAVPAVAWALVMLAVCLRRAEPLRMLGLMVLGVLVFYATARLFGITPAELAQQGWLLKGAGGAQAAAAPVSAWPDFTAVDWDAVAGVAGSLATVPLVTAIALMLNVAGLETTVRRPVDIDRELRAAGVANLASGLGGGYVGYQQLGLSTMNLCAGTSTRLVGLWAAIVCLAALAFGTDLLAWLPRPVLGAQLLLLALLVVRPWMLEARGRLTAMDQGIVVTIVLATALVGFLQAVLLGLVAAALLFAVQSGRVDPVRQALSGADYGSRRLRAPADLQGLRELGDAICVLQLQGYMFFGIADRLQAAALDRLRDRARPALRFLVLDCRRVNGCDSSAAQGLLRLNELLHARGATLVVCQAPAAVARQLDTAGLGERDDEDSGSGGSRASNGSPRFDDLDHGLEWCETTLLRESGAPARVPVGGTLRAQLGRVLGGAAAADDLLVRLERIELQPGEVLIAQGRATQELYLLETGALIARRLREGARPMRLQAVSGGGEIVGEVGFFLDDPRTADVVAEAASVVYRLTRAHLLALEQERPELAAAVLRLFCEKMAARVAHLVSVVDALEDR